MLNGVIPHDVLGVEKVGDGRVRDAQLPVRLCQPPLRPGKKYFALSPEIQKIDLNHRDRSKPCDGKSEYIYAIKPAEN